jgi:hypothetical protein
LERGPLSLVRTTEEVIDWKSSGFDLVNRDKGKDRTTENVQKRNVCTAVRSSLLIRRCSSSKKFWTCNAPRRPTVDLFPEPVEYGPHTRLKSLKPILMSTSNQRVPFHQGLPTGILYIFFILSIGCYNCCPPHPVVNNIKWRTQIMKLLVTYFSPCFLLLWFIYPWRLVFEPRQDIFSAHSVRN